MKRIGNLSLLSYATVIYAISALLLPVIFETTTQQVIGSRVIPGEGDNLELTLRWPVVATLLVVASLIPAWALSMRFSGFRLALLSVLTAVIAEIFISIFLLWLNARPLPQDYPILSAARILNSSDSWPYEMSWRLVCSALRLVVFPMTVLAIASVNRGMFARNFFGKTLKSAAN